MASPGGPALCICAVLLLLLCVAFVHSSSAVSCRLISCWLFLLRRHNVVMLTLLIGTSCRGNKGTNRCSYAHLCENYERSIPGRLQYLYVRSRVVFWLAQPVGVITSICCCCREPHPPPPAGRVALPVCLFRLFAPLPITAVPISLRVKYGSGLIPARAADVQRILARSRFHRPLNKRVIRPRLSCSKSRLSLLLLPLSCARILVLSSFPLYGMAFCGKYVRHNIPFNAQSTGTLPNPSILPVYLHWQYILRLYPALLCAADVSESTV